MDFIKKFEFTDFEKEIPLSGIVMVKQIRALIDIPLHGVKAGQVGGYLEDEDCLSHFGSAWVADDAVILSSSTISGDAIVKEDAIVYGECFLHGTIEVSGEASVSYSNVQGENIKIQGNSCLQMTTIRGSRILITDEVLVTAIEIKAKDLQIGGNARMVAYNPNKKTILEGERIMIGEDAELYDLHSLKGIDVRIDGSAFLNMVTIDGENISVQDATSVLDGVILNSNVHLSDCVEITSLFGSSISNVQLSGDGTYTVEAMGA